MIQYNKNPRRNPNQVRDASERVKDFKEVSNGLTLDSVKDEASRCMQCVRPMCQKGCPVSLNIPSFMNKVKDGDIDGAYEIISKDSCLPSICGRVCPQETQCEGSCLRGKIKSDKVNFDDPVSIGAVERYVADHHSKTSIKKPKLNGKKVAVIGSGPASVSCAYDLAVNGVKVTMYEALHLPGGVLMYGIPSFRLPKDIVQNEINKLKELGVDIVTDFVIGKTLTMDQLSSEYDSIFLAYGAGLPKFMNIKGEDSIGVFSANEYLTRVNLMHANESESKTPLYKSKKAVVVGGGNVAMDACRVLRRLGSEVHCVYRRSEEELPARKEEVIHAKEEGIIFNFLTSPIEINSDRSGSLSRRDPNYNPNYGHVTSITVQKQKLTEPDASGRRKPVPVDVSEDKDAIYKIDCDCVVLALGTSPNPVLTSSCDIKTDSHGCLVVDENLMTSIPGVFAGGDAVTGAATVISAMGAGRKAAKSILKYIGIEN